MNKNVALTAGFLVVGALGAAAGYFVADKKLEGKYRLISEREIEEARVYYQRLYQRSDILLDSETPVETESELEESVVPPLVDAEPGRLIQERVQAMDAMQTYSGTPEEDQPRNVFEHPTPPSEDVLDALLADRDTSKPYIITRGEFLDSEYDQFAFTYFEGDSVLIRDNDEYNPIEDVDKVAGEDNLLHFGYGSDDPTVVYIRNEDDSGPFDLHVTQSPGSYVNEILNSDEEDRSPQLKHSQRRFRLHDE